MLEFSVVGNVCQGLGEGLERKTWRSKTKRGNSLVSEDSDLINGLALR